MAALYDVSPLTRPQGAHSRTKGDNTIAALRETVVAKEKALRALEDAVAAKDKTIEALKDSPQFFDAHVQAIGGMQSEGSRQEVDPTRKWTELDNKEDQEAGLPIETGKPRWKKLLGLP